MVLELTRLITSANTGITPQQGWLFYDGEQGGNRVVRLDSHWREAYPSNSVITIYALLAGMT